MPGSAVGADDAVQETLIRAGEASIDSTKAADTTWLYRATNSSKIFPIFFAILVWLGLWLRERARKLI